MQKQTHRRTPMFLAAGLLTASLALAPMSVSAKTCSSGSCGGPSAIELVEKAAKRATQTTQSGSLEDAYDSIEQVSDTAEKNNLERTRKVQQWMRELMAALQKRAAAELEAAQGYYADGNYAKAVAEYERIAKLEGIPAAKEAAKLLSFEDDRVAWREARDQAEKFVAAQQHGEAQETFAELDRLAKSGDLRQENRDLMSELAKEMLPHVEQAQKAVEAEQFESAYAKLIEISRLSGARESAVAARRALAQHASVPGMRLAKAEYDSQRELTQTKAKFSEIKSPSPRELQRFEAQLSQLIERFPGTRAAEKAAALLADTKPTQQAAR